MYKLIFKIDITAQFWDLWVSHYFIKLCVQTAALLPLTSVMGRRCAFLETQFPPLPTYLMWLMTIKHKFSNH